MGEVLSATGTMAAVNPLRYRGYYYDAETGLYYLQSRYYDPALKRFLNADGLASTGQGILGTNMFAYCGNDPVAFCDSGGSRMVYNVSVDDGGGRAKRVRYDVPLYDQGDWGLCWAACQLMMYSYKNNIQISDNQAEDLIQLTAMIKAFTKKEKNWDSPGWPSDLGDKIYIYSIEELYDVLVYSGPVYAYYREPEKSDPAQQRAAHLVIVTGVDVDRGIVFTNNPHGYSGGQTYSSFLNGYLTRNGTSNNRYFEWLYLVKGALS